MGLDGIIEIIKDLIHEGQTGPEESIRENLEDASGDPADPIRGHDVAASSRHPFGDPAHVLPFSTDPLDEDSEIEGALSITAVSQGESIDAA